MPHLDGYGVLHGIRTDTAIAAIPIIAVTAFESPADADRYLSAGFDGALGKPVQLDELKSTLKKHLG